LIYAGTGGTGDSLGTLFSYDPATGQFDTGLGQAVADETSVESLVCGAGSTLYGGTYPNAHLFRYRPGDGHEDLGQPLPGETWLKGLALGSDGVLYGGGQHVFAYDPDTGLATDLGQPVPNDNQVFGMQAAPDGTVYGVTGGNEGHLFAYDPVTGVLADLGRVYPHERSTYGLALSADGQTAYLGTGYNYGQLVAYARNYGFGWLTLDYQAGMPAGTELQVDILDPSGAMLLEGVAPGSSLLGISAPDHPVLQLRARLSTTVPQLTPALLEWSVAWTEDPVMEVTPPALSFRAEAGGSDPHPQTLRVENTSGGELAWSMAGLPAWLAADPLSGVAPSSVMARAHVVGLAPGVYTAVLLIEGGADCQNCPLELPVTFSVEEELVSIYLPVMMRQVQTP
jgi:hypothetical protein